MSSSVPGVDRPRLWRSRWAAIGAAVAVTFGGGGLFAVNAASPESSVVSIEPVRVLDTRDPVNVGLAGPFVSPVPQDLKVTGSIPTTTGTKTVVPAGATGVFLNVTPVGSTAAGFISVRPANAAGLPSTSNVNFTVGAINPNAVLVELPVGGADDGKIEITFDAFGVAGPTSDVLVDVVGYTSVTRLAALEASKANKADVGAGYVTNSGSDILSFTTTDITVASLSLPAGSYVVNATLVANNNVAGQNEIGCTLRLNTTSIDSLRDTLLFPLAANGTAGSRESVALTGAGTLASAGTANVVCRAESASGNWLARTITAMQVSTLTGTGSPLTDGSELTEPAQITDATD